MPRIDAISEQTYDVANQTTFLLQVAAQPCESQEIVDESLTLTGPVDSGALEEHTLTGESNRLHRFVCPPGRVTIRYAATVETELSIADGVQESETLAHLPPETIRYTVPSRYCESDKLADWAGQTFGHLHADDSRVMAIANWIFDHFAYTPGATDASTSAADIILSGGASPGTDKPYQGVCRDYAHVMIATCRALDIPARYISGYVANLQPPDFHALVEVYVGNGWYLHDPTRLAPRTGLVRIARGLDAAETAFCTLIGSAQLVEQTVSAVRTDGEVDTDPVRVRVD